MGPCAGSRVLMWLWDGPCVGLGVNFLGYLYFPLSLTFAFLIPNLHSQHSPPLHHPSLPALTQPFNSPLTNHINNVLLVLSGKCPLLDRV